MDDRLLRSGDAAAWCGDGVPWAETDRKALVAVSDYGTGFGRAGSVPADGGAGRRDHNAVRLDVGGGAAARMAQDGRLHTRNGLEQKKCGAGGCCRDRRWLGLLF